MVLPGAVSLFLAFCITALLLLLLWKSPASKAKLPPGPTPLPLVGNAVQVSVPNLVQALQRVSTAWLLLEGHTGWGPS